MDTVITVVAIGILAGMLVLMVNYARFIHGYSGETRKDAEKDLAESKKETSGKEDSPGS